MTEMEGSDVQDTEAGIHPRVQGIGREAGEVRAEHRRGSAGTGVGRPDAAQLGQGHRTGEAESAWGEGGHAGTDGTVALAGGESQAQDGVRNPKKSDGVLRERCAVKYAWIDGQRKA